MLPRRRRSRFCGVVAVVLCVLVASTFGNPSWVLGQPVYTVSASMPTKTINPLSEGRLNITFQVSGVGSFREATIKVESDAMNLVAWSLRVRGYYIAKYDKLVQFYDSSEVSYDYSTTLGPSSSKGYSGELGFPGPVANATNGYLDSSRIQLLGNIILDTTGMSAGSYVIKITFTAQRQDGNYKFDSSLVYSVLDLWQANPWLAPLVAGIILAVIAGGYRFLLPRLGRRRKREPQERLERITVKRSYQEGQLESEELTFTGQKAIEKYVNGMSKSIRLEAVSNVGVIELVRQGRYDQAGLEARKAIEAIESSRTRRNTLELGQLYLIRGDAAFNTGRFAEAEQSYGLSLKLAREVKDDSLSTAAYLGVGIAKGSQGDDIGALEILDRIQNATGTGFFDRIPNATGTIFWLNKGSALLNLGRYDEAAKAYDQSLKISHRLHDQIGAAVSLHRLGMIEHAKGHYEEAKRLYNESLAVERKLGNSWGIATALTQLGLVELERGNYDGAKKLYEQSLEIYRSMGEQFGIALCLNNLGLIEQNRGNYNDATRLYNQALEIASKLGDKKRIAMTMGNLAIIARQQGHYDEARQSFKQARAIYEALGARPELAICLNNLGAVEQVVGNYDEASRLYRLSLDMMRKLGYESKMPNTLRNLGDIASHQGDRSEAIKLYKESLQVSRKLGDRSGIATSLHSLGIEEQHMGNYDEAKRLYDQSLQIRLKLGEQLGIAQTLHQLANIESFKRNFDEARILYEKSLTLNRALGNRLGQAQSIRQLGFLDEAQGRVESAEKHYQEALQIFNALGRREDLARTEEDLERARATRRSVN